ncbi:MAG TPA: class E sortase [Acidimicrobiales bacterium]|nr:class E sortase [Acidimicrobiales bacterium]
MVLLDVMRLRLLLAAAVAVLLAGAGALVVEQDGAQEVRAGDDVAAAAVALAATAEPAVEADLDPLAGISVRTISAAVPADPTAPLPVPEDPPADPYEAEPEIRHGTLEIPRIGLAQPLFEGVSLTAINRGPSHWPGTAMPGELGNVVVAGHRTTYTRPFWDLQALHPGDELIFAMADGSRHVYVLDRLDIVSPTDIHIVDQTRAHTATLFACHPRGSARQRIVAHFTMRGEQEQLQLTDTHQIRAPR